MGRVAVVVVRSDMGRGTDMGRGGKVGVRSWWRSGVVVADMGRVRSAGVVVADMGSWCLCRGAVVVGRTYRMRFVFCRESLPTAVIRRGRGGWRGTVLEFFEWSEVSEIKIFGQMDDDSRSDGAVNRGSQRDGAEGFSDRSFYYMSCQLVYS